uniref:MRH domain-containing protein n=1 Tax=Fibrocapsa japonica TaxID=94617 RepID=A0A7S2V107_9STRA|mmetsp:Transcript_19349/g.27938  ORF Transcript_19349/g.27938 Transcript_19349/m.27938 type:complete len:403 (+) Transcript_19349:171-1379(+)
MHFVDQDFFRCLFLLGLLPHLLFGFNLGLPSGLYDEFGCAINEGYFWCGSSSRCLKGWDTCEDGAADPVDCQLRASGLTWDLVPLRRSASSDYFLYAAGLSNVSIIFNVCGNAGTPWDKGCHQTFGVGHNQAQVLPAPAFAMDEGAKECKRLGGSVLGGKNMKMSMIDPMDPMLGVSITYSGGNSCQGLPLYNCVQPISEMDIALDDRSARGDVCRHSMEVSVKCHPGLTSTPTFEDIRIYQPCTYRLTLHSVHGCPLECPRDKQGRICGAQGVCQFERQFDGHTLTYSEPHCLCEAPYKGPSCSSDFHSILSKQRLVGPFLPIVGTVPPYVIFIVFVAAFAAIGWKSLRARRLGIMLWAHTRRLLNKQAALAHKKAEPMEPIEMAGPNPMVLSKKEDAVML